MHRFEPGPGDATLLLLHGTGGDENDLIPLARAVAPDAPILSPRGQVLENGMPRFFKRHGMGLFDVEDLALRTDALAGFLETAAANYGIDLDRVVALGYSNGANIAASLLLRHPGAVKRAALLHAMLPFEPEGAVDLSGSSVLLTSGDDDRMIPLSSSVRLVEVLERSGAAVEHAIFPGGHELTADELATLRRWLLAAMPSPDGEAMS